MPNPPTHPFAIRFSDKQLEELRSVSEKQGLPVATLIKVCVEAMLREYRANPQSLNFLAWGDVAKHLDNRRSHPSYEADVPYQGVAEVEALADDDLTQGPVGVISAGGPQDSLPVSYLKKTRTKPKPKP